MSSPTLSPTLQAMADALGSAIGSSEAASAIVSNVVRKRPTETEKVAAAREVLVDHGVHPDAVVVPPPAPLTPEPVAEPEPHAPAPTGQPYPTGYFRAPDAIFEPMLLAGTPRLVYLYLCRRSNRRSESWPGLERIADDTGLSVSSAQRALKALRALRMVQRRRRPNKSNVYSTRPPADWLVRPAIRPGQPDRSEHRAENSGPVALTGGMVTLTDPVRSP